MFFIVLMRDGTEWWIVVPTALGCLLPMKGFFRVAGLAVNPSQSLPGVSSGSVSQAWVVSTVGGSKGAWVVASVRVSEGAPVVPVSAVYPVEHPQERPQGV